MKVVYYRHKVNIHRTYLLSSYSHFIWRKILYEFDSSEFSKINPEMWYIYAEFSMNN